MKAFAVVLTLCFVGAYACIPTDEQKTKLREYKEACITESGVDAGVVEAIAKGGATTPGIKLKCFSACMLKKIGVMNADATINVDTARAKAATCTDQAKINEVINKCKDLTGKYACETGGKVFGCFIANKLSLLY